MAVSLALPSAAYANPLADLLGLGSDAAPAAAFDEQKTVDGSTITTWEDIARQNTQNIGRIWTDKTVSSSDVQLPASSAGVAPKVEIGDSDFLVTLSALSSTSNTSVTSSKPLDIVLVLDASGSMGIPSRRSMLTIKRTVSARTDEPRITPRLTMARMSRLIGLRIGAVNLTTGSSTARRLTPRRAPMIPTLLISSSIRVEPP